MVHLNTPGYQEKKPFADRTSRKTAIIKRTPAQFGVASCIQFDKQLLQRKRGGVVEYLIVVTKIVGSRPSAAVFEIFQLCQSFFCLREDSIRGLL